MFFREPDDLPRELILIILSNLSVQDAITFLTTSKDMQAQAFVNEDRRWKKFGADSFADFMARISKLPIFFKQAIIGGRYQLPFCEDICNQIYYRNPMEALIKLLPPTDRGGHIDNPFPIFKIIMPEYSDTIPDGDLKYRTMNLEMQRSIAIGFIEKLISPEQMKNLHPEAIYNLFLVSGIKALKNNLITPEYAATVNPPQSLSTLLFALVHHFEAGNDIRLCLQDDAEKYKDNKLSKILTHYLNNYTTHKGTAEEKNTNEETAHKKPRKE